MAAHTPGERARLIASLDRAVWRGGNGWSATCAFCGGYERHPAMDQDYYGTAGHKDGCAYLAIRQILATDGSSPTDVETNP